MNIQSAEPMSPRQYIIFTTHTQIQHNHASERERERVQYPIRPLRFLSAVAVLTCLAWNVRLGLNVAPVGEEEEEARNLPTLTTPILPKTKATNAKKKNELPIVDSILYNGEPIILIRLELLYDFVDRFYITESTVTFSGKPKPLHSKQHLKDFEPYQDKITWLVYEPAENITGAWERESKQRQFAVTQMRSDVENQTLSTPFVVINTDGDELVNPKILEDMQPGGSFHSQVLTQAMFLEMTWCCYNANWKKNGNWTKGHVLPGEKLLSGEYNLQTFRNKRRGKPSLPEAGWHLTYFLSIDEMIHKIESFSHQEYNKPWVKNRTRIEDCIRNGKELYGRTWWVEQMTPYDPTTLPLPLQRFHQDVVARQNITQK